MKFKYLLAVFCVLFLSDVAFADGENDIKGMFPFMGFIYYSDELVVDSTGGRFLRGAVLITKAWLVTSAVQISDNVNDGFPRKTLLARFGAVAIDNKFTLNEDEDEQEREIIQIVRPYNHSATQWWRTDITLMLVLLPFNITSTVKPIQLPLPSRNEKTHQCSIIIYAKRYGNSSEERVLTQSSVDLLPPSIQNCGSNFFEDTMICAGDVEEKNDFFDPATFCQGNSGGPLVCEGNPMALQTYIDNNCKAPHLYQLFTPWKQLIECATEDKCDDRVCAGRCVITNKDAPLTLESSTTLLSTASETVVTHSTTVTISVETTPETSEVTFVTSTKSTTLQTETTTTEVTEEVHDTTTTTITEVSTASTMKEDTEQQPAQEQAQLPVQETVAQPPSHTQAWPKEKEESKKLAQEEECDDAKRRTNVEAQQDARQNTWQDIMVPQKKKAHSAAERNMCLFQSVFCAIVLLSFL